MTYNNTCYIIGAGNFAKTKFKPSENDFIICADGGFNAIKDMVKPNMVIGDNDSIKKPIDDQSITTLNFPKEKDDTDMVLAVLEGIKLGFKNFKIFGGYGNRLDHVLANIQMLHRFSLLNCNLELVAAKFSIFCLSSSTFSSAVSSKGKTLSLFSLSDQSTGVSIEGLKYTLKDATLTNTNALGVSNQSIGLPIKISISHGCLLIISFDDKINEHYNITF